ncbi:Pimeloyl-ACP methyl ester carboxylesterase [Amycolatopsis marina]|uniref:Pimeloyl-ACP methyl ester carboxylesterase n=1 Tax=Amycolatopsis marina TaxID=490629 RepID=A0A1I1CC54_9PSEU|nr:alpha/beta hydrolase [Amycolatopsis marina]SFB58330.1 Pimeloyl-ACP methyl ester carboxylesterase [Amycolatopsis marina]
MVDELVVPGEPAVVVRDFGGARDGGSIVLLHGFGGNALNWTTFAPLLTDRYRVVALDFRCHGKSGDGPWQWELLVDDVERVVTHLGLDRPAMVGHSLGGGVAALWARRHPECPGAVDIDGIRAVETAEENYIGADRKTIRRQLTELSSTFQAQATAMAGPLTDEQHAAMREHHRQLGGDVAVEAFERNVMSQDGSRFLRPATETVTAFRAQMIDLDLFEVFASARCPLLVCAATRDLPDTEQYAELLDAHRRGIERDLVVAERDNPDLRVERFPASHNMVHEHPATLAALIRKFVG